MRLLWPWRTRRACRGRWRRSRLTRLWWCLRLLVRPLFVDFDFDSACASTDTPIPAATSTSSSSSRTLPQLPRLARFLLVASFLASYNPPKKDLAFFGRGRWEEGGAAGKRRRRGGPAPTKRLTKKGSVAKVDSLLLSFSLLH